MRAVLAAIGLTLILASHAAAFSIEAERLFGDDTAAQRLAVISTTDIDVFAPLIEDYRARHPGVAVRYVVTSTSELYRAIADEGARFDVAISSAMDLQMKLANDGFALPHTSAATARLPAWAHWRDQLFAFTQEPVVTLVSRKGFEGMPLPRTRADLIDAIRSDPARFEGRIGTYDPNRSGAGYLFATQDARASDTFWRLAEVFGRVQPRLYATTSAMIDDLQSGKLILAYNLLGPYVSARLKGWPDAAVIEFRDFTHILLRTALIPKGAEAPGPAHAFLDYLLSADGQAALARDTGLPPIDEAALATQPHLRPIRLDPGLLVYVDPLKRRKFLNEWTDAVVQK